MRHSLRDPKTGRFKAKIVTHREIKLTCGIETLKKFNALFAEYLKAHPIKFKKG